MQKYCKKLHIDLISTYQTLPKIFINDLENELEWSHFSGLQTLSEPFIEEFGHKVDFCTRSKLKNLMVHKRHTLSDSFCNIHCIKAYMRFNIRNMYGGLRTIYMDEVLNPTCPFFKPVPA